MARKQTYSYKTKRNEAVYTRMVIVFVLLLVSVFSMLSVRNWLSTTAAVDSYEVYLNVVRLLPILPIILTLISAFYFYRCKKSGADEYLKILSSGFLLCICLVFLVVTAFISKYVYTGYVPAIVFVVLVSLLYFIAVSFPGSYLVMTVFNAMGAFTIYALHLVSPINNPVMHYVLRIIAVLVAFAFIALVYKARAKGGEICGIKLLKSGGDIFPLTAAAVIFAAFIILGMLEIGSYVIYDVIIALETIIFALFYSVKTLK